MRAASCRFFAAPRQPPWVPTMCIAWAGTPRAVRSALTRAMIFFSNDAIVAGTTARPAVWSSILWLRKGLKTAEQPRSVLYSPNFEFKCNTSVPPQACAYSIAMHGAQRSRPLFVFVLGDSPTWKPHPCTCVYPRQTPTPSWSPFENSTSTRIPCPPQNLTHGFQLNIDSSPTRNPFRSESDFAKAVHKSLSVVKSRSEKHSVL